MAVYPKTLPTKNMPNAAPTRKIYSTNDQQEPQVLKTPQHQSGTLAFARSKGITNATFAGQRKTRV